MGRIPLALALLAAAFALAAAPAPAATFTVSNSADELDGACDDADCSLRDAVALANADADFDTIRLPPGDYLLDQHGQLTLSQPVRIAGVSGATPRNTTVRGAGSQRVFEVRANATLELFSITSGRADGGAGDGRGGGIYQSGGNLTLNWVRIAQNTAVGGGLANGGGIAHESAGLLEINHSTISGNSATGGSGRGAGGGLRINADTGKVTITNSTIDSNTVSGGDANSTGGGISNSQRTNVNLQNVTVTSNRVAGTGFGGNISASADPGAQPTFHVRNTLVAYGTASNANSANCGAQPGAIESLGNNLDPTPAHQCQFAQGGDVTADPNLIALADNGGPTDTRAFPASSPATDAGSNTGCPSADQRGVPRPQGPVCDIGAVEVLGGAGGGGGGADTEAPVLSALRFSRSRFPAAPSGPSARGTRTYGATVSYRLSEKARTRFTVERAVTGRRVGGRCRARTRANRSRPRCTRWKKVSGSFTRSGEAGRNSFRFTGRIGGKRLKPGRYRLVAAARDGAGNRARVVRRTFRIVS